MRSFDSLPPRTQRWLVYAALVGVGVLFVLSGLLTNRTPDLAAIRAVEAAVGSNDASVRVSGRYIFTDVDGSSPYGVQLACGTVVVGGQERRLAALVRNEGRRAELFAVDELAIEQPSSQSLLVREVQLLGACPRG